MAGLGAGVTASVRGMSVPRAVEVKVMAGMNTVWEVQVGNAYPVRQPLSARGLSYHPGRKTWDKWVEPQQVQGVVFEVLDILARYRVNLSAKSSPVVGDLLLDSTAFYDNASGDRVWQTMPANFREPVDTGQWIHLLMSSVLRHPFEWIEEPTSFQTMLPELTAKPKVFEDLLLRLSLAGAVKAPAEWTRGLARDDQLRSLFALYRHHYPDLGLNPKHLRQRKEWIAEGIAQAGENWEAHTAEWGHLEMVYVKLEALGLLDDEDPGQSASA